MGEREPHDLDLALLTKDQPAWKLWDAIAEAVGSEQPDLVDLRRASPVLLFEIISVRNLLYASDESLSSLFEKCVIFEELYGQIRGLGGKASERTKSGLVSLIPEG